MLRDPSNSSSSEQQSRGVKRPAGSDSEPDDEVQLGVDGWKSRYYLSKFDEENYTELSRKIAQEYTRGLCWVLLYYYQGCPDWKWFYPYHYAPFASDFVDIHETPIDFDPEARPFRPLEQLMGVFPAASCSNLPKSWRRLMNEPKSPIIDFYPTDFRIDLNGKTAAWMGVALLPFIDEDRLLKALESVYPNLTEGQKERNSFGSDLLFVSKRKDNMKKFIKNLKKETETEKIAVDVTSFNGFAGLVKKSKYFDEFENSACVEYYDPEYPKGFVFLARKLEGARVPEKLLNPIDNDEKIEWLPFLGKSRDYQQASVGEEGKRMINFHTNNYQRNQQPKNQHYYNNQSDQYSNRQQRNYGSSSYPPSNHYQRNSYPPQQYNPRNQFQQPRSFYQPQTSNYSNMNDYQSSPSGYRPNFRPRRPDFQNRHSNNNNNNNWSRR